MSVQSSSAFFVLCHIADMLFTGVSPRYDVPSHTVTRAHTGTMCERVVRMSVKRTVGILARRDMNTPGYSVWVCSSHDRKAYSRYLIRHVCRQLTIRPHLASIQTQTHTGCMWVHRLADTQDSGGLRQGRFKKPAARRRGEHDVLRHHIRIRTMNTCPSWMAAMAARRPSGWPP